MSTEFENRIAGAARPLHGAGSTLACIEDTLRSGVGEASSLVRRHPVAAVALGAVLAAAATALVIGLRQDRHSSLWRRAARHFGHR